MEIRQLIEIMSRRKNYEVLSAIFVHPKSSEKWLGAKLLTPRHEIIDLLMELRGHNLVKYSLLRDKRVWSLTRGCRLVLREVKRLSAKPKDSRLEDPKPEDPKPKDI